LWGPEVVKRGVALLLCGVTLAAACRASDAAAPATSESLEFAIQPLQAVACTPIAPLAVRAMVNGQLATGFNGAVALSLVSGTGSPAAVLSGTRVAQAVAGTATFVDLSVNVPGADYRLMATVAASAARSVGPAGAASVVLDGAAIFADAVSSPISVVAGGPTQLTFSTNPATSVVGATLAPVRVTIRDACSGAVNNSSLPVSIALGSNPVGAELFGTTTVSAVNGVATFPNLWLNRPSAGYTLVASSAGLAQANSNAFTIAGTP
jgi:hypothetical protein